MAQIGLPAGLLEEQLLWMLPESDPRRQRGRLVPADSAVAPSSLEPPSTAPNLRTKHYPAGSADALDSVVRQLEAGLQQQQQQQRPSGR